MRKLLLTTTALATVASFSALADLKTKGDFEWSANSLASKDTTRDGDKFSTDSQIVFSFSNSTADGLNIGYTVELDTDGAATVIDETSMSISHKSFGQFILGNNDGAADKYNLAAEDVMGEEASPLQISATIGTNTDVSLDANDNNKITYIMKPMMDGNLKAGVSYESGGAGVESNSTTSIGAQYGMDVGGMAVTVAATNAVKEGKMGLSGNTNTEHSGMGIKLVTGAITVIAASAEKDSNFDVIESSGIGASYTLPSGTVLSAYSMTSKDTMDTSETYENVGLEAKITIVKGLKAIITYNDFTYTKPTVDAGGQAATTPADDSGTNTKLTIQAAF